MYELLGDVPLPVWESVRTFSSKQLGDVGPALAVGSDADRDAKASKPIHPVRNGRRQAQKLTMMELVG